MYQIANKIDWEKFEKEFGKNSERITQRKPEDPDCESGC
ncbi:hypothetical protein LEP1GSC005_2696 [Leptospira santarosai str. ST188]|nr:hypothetical protein LEP1GSC005_2696 [Leptospira santarosai str. ST188]